jgi:hypothetical protein
MKRNTHVIVPGSKFTLARGEQQLSTYQASWLRIRQAGCDRNAPV